MRGKIGGKIGHFATGQKLSLAGIIDREKLISQ